ncbi:MAG: dihydrolipoamide acetyltransferase family protein, partial [Acidimicrobiales bacterium]
PATPAAPAPASEAGESDGAERTPVLVGYGVSPDRARRHRHHAPAPAAPTPAPAAPAAASGQLVARTTPPVRLYARQHGVDLSTLTGTGRDGIITRADVEQALRAPAAAPAAPAASLAPTRFAGHELAAWDVGPREERIAVRGVARAMAEAMTASAFSAPHAATWVRVDATKTMELVAALRERPAFASLRVSPLLIVALALCDGARHFPGINSSFDAAAGEVIVRRQVNLGIAVASPRGLLVPNIKGADAMTPAELAAALTGTIDRARAATSTPDEMLHTTLTITNVGPYHVDGAVPILPPGTGAIVAVGQIARRPWVVGDAVVPRETVDLSMAFDHRQIDGALASAFLAHVGQFLEDPAPAMIAP